MSKQPIENAPDFRGLTVQELYDQLGKIIETGGGHKTCQFFRSTYIQDNRMGFPLRHLDHQEYTNTCYLEALTEEETDLLSEGELPSHYFDILPIIPYS